VTAKTPINKDEATHVCRARAFFPVGAEYFDTDLDGTGEKRTSFICILRPAQRVSSDTHTL
jgi:hypothetical protein